MPVKPLELAAILALVGAAQAPLDAQLPPPSTGGIVALDFLLQRLAENRRVLVIGAHPDDEDTAFLTLVARGYGADAAYLSLCRGEGGQNLVGDELGAALGLLRTGELVSARSIDGGQQFFTRAYDFGFSKSLEETARFWSPDSILKDVVRVVRRFKPHVVLSIFAATPADGHGQHQAAGVAALEAFDAAGDPARFTELAEEENLEPWRPLKLYRSAWLDPASATLELPTGIIESRSGRTYQQIAMASRSRHRSQDMGRPQPIGPASTRLSLLADRTAAELDSGDALFLGIPADSGWLVRFADSLRNAITARNISAAVAPLAKSIERAESNAVQQHRRTMLAEAMAIAAGLVIDARAESAEIVSAQPFGVTVEIHNGGPFDVGVEHVSILAPDTWHTRLLGGESRQLNADMLREFDFEVEVPSTAAPTQPYYLERPRVGGLYDWHHVHSTVRGLPLQPPELWTAVQFSVFGATFTIEREVTYRYTDQAIGEKRLPVRVVPLVDVKLEPRTLIWPAEDGNDRTFVVTLVNNGDSAVDGMVSLEAANLATPDPVPFRIAARGKPQSLRFQLSRPAEGQRTRVRLRAVARTTDGQVFDKGVLTVSYQHIRPSSMVIDAVSDVRIEPIRFPSRRNVAYVRGAADRVPEALEQFGLPVRLLGAEELARADLSSFDAIVVGSRAYETDTALVNHNDRLLSYVESGGHMLVLYQQYQFAAGDYAPYDIRISRPHDRITDETAPVTVLAPNHAAFSYPNGISDDDWNGWPQERGLYFAGQWDDAFTPLLEMEDPDSEPVRGGLIVAQYGEGTYVYTGLSFFRAIPAGVVGAYRLFLNLVALGAGNK